MVEPAKGMPPVARWISYQRERFPLLVHGTLIAVFSVSAISFSTLLRGQAHLPSMLLLAGAFICTLFIFLQLRIADEFKDFEEDRLYRPYRPVPRGLVTLAELRTIGLLCAIAQVAITFVAAPRLVALLLLVWGYLGLMTAEFFVPEWLKRRPVVYMLSHMAIMPLIVLYVSGFDWAAAGAPIPRGLLWLLLASFPNGIVLEIGRKMKAPTNEEAGVETYSWLWGARTAIGVWLSAIVASGVFAVAAASIVDGWVFELIALGSVLCLAVATAIWFVSSQTTKSAKMIELTSALWGLAVYLSIGILRVVTGPNL